MARKSYAASTILGFNVFLQTPEGLGKDHDELLRSLPQRNVGAFIGKTVPAAEVAEATRHLESHKSAGKVVLTFYSDSTRSHQSPL